MATYQKRANYWRVLIRRKGYKALSKTFNTKADAEKWALAIESRIYDGSFQDTKEVQRITLSECLARYGQEVTPSKKGAKREFDRIKQMQREPLSLRPIGLVKSFDIAAWRDGKIKAGSAPSTVTKELALFSHVFTIAIKEWNLPLTNPVANVRKPRVNNARDRRLEPGELERILEHCGDELRAWVVLAIETAMRRGEQYSLKSSMIHGRLIHLTDTKNGLSRVVPLSSTALQTISRLTPRIDGSYWHYPIDYYTKSFIKACRLANSENLKLHDLRREGCSRLLEKGLSIFEVKSISGHRSTKMLERYVKVYSDDLLKKLG